MTSLTDAYAELEIGLHRGVGGSYQIELRYTEPGSQGERAPVRGDVSIPFDQLRDLQRQPLQYGEALAKSLFSTEKLRSEFSQIKAAVESGGLILRIRLLIGTGAPELHGLRWELLVDFDTNTPLATSERMIFSRFMVSDDWRRIDLRPKGQMRAVVAIAAPSNLDNYRLADIDFEGESRRAKEALAGLEVAVLGGSSPVTLESLIDALRGDVDILYLVCHGTLLSASGLSDQEVAFPYLFLEDENREVKRVNGADFARRIEDLARVPRLVVLASCQSAGKDAPSGSEDDGQIFQAALAPRLAKAGVPAVVAMQGNISIETATVAMPRFFAELMVDGRIDRAMAAARGAVRDRPDSWMPALFLRLKGGRIWYEPGFGEKQDASVKWKGLADAVNSRRFTPIVGWGLAEKIYGNKSDLALRLAEEQHVPLAVSRRSELPLVSQCLLVNQSSVSYALNMVKERMRAEVLTRHRSRMAPELESAPLSRLLREAIRLHFDDDGDPFRNVANLPARLFINASPDNLLVEALTKAGKHPRIQYAYWKRAAPPPEVADFEPTEESPLVFHIFGYFGEPESLVLSEDEYLDYLIGVSLNKSLTSELVREALVNRSLIFLGFYLTDWTFRVLFRLIMSLMGGGSRRDRIPHAAVQLEPDGGLLSDVDEARKYLKSYYGESHIDPYWGKSEDFLAELMPLLGNRMSSNGGERRANPFVGPGSLTLENGFFGRERELRQLFYLLIAERIVWLHSPSGAGKTSLIQAGLIPRLERDGFQVQPVIRVNMQPPATNGEPMNRYEYSVLSSLGAGPTDRLATRLARGKDGGSAAASPVLIFDQFEEVLTLDPADVEAKRDFFRELGAALRLPHVWALFAIREEFLPAMGPYVRLIPTQMSNALRLDVLGLDQAREVMTKTAETGGREFQTAAVERLSLDLARIQAPLGKGKFESRPGISVEPMQLQVVCRSLWESMPAREDSIGVEHLAAYGDVTATLGRYYAQCLASVCGAEVAQERALREWIEAKLITPGGLRNQVPADDMDAGFEGPIGRLVNSYLVRAESRNGRTWYELAHDRLVEPVNSGNAQWFEEHLNWMQRRAALWLRQHRPKTLLLTDDELAKAEQLSREATSLSPNEEEFLRESREKQWAIDRERRQAKLVRRWSVAAAILALAAVVALASLYVAQRKERSPELAAIAQTEMLEHPVCALKDALGGLDAWETRPATEALQMALQNLGPEWEIDSHDSDTHLSVRDYLATRAGNEITVFESPNRPDRKYVARWRAAAGCDISAFQLSREGRIMAIGFENGRVQVLSVQDTAGIREVSCGGRFAASQGVSAIRYFKSGVRVDLDRNGLIQAGAAWRETLSGNGALSMAVEEGERIAVGMGDGTVRVLPGAMRALQYSTTSVPVTSVAFAGNRIAAASRSNGRVVVWDANTGSILFDVTTDDTGNAAVVLSPDGAQLATAGLSTANQVQLWSVASRKVVLALSAPAPKASDRLSDAVFLNRAVVVSDTSGKVRLYPLDASALRDRARKYLAAHANDASQCKRSN